MKSAKQLETRSAQGLRERKKRALRAELSLAALRLAKQRGLENVRTEDIVAAVGVSRRTFNNYFANKYEAIVDRYVERVRQAAEGLRARPRGETLWQALTAAILAPFEDTANAFVAGPDAQRKADTLLLFEDPSLRAEMSKGDFAAQQALAQAVAKRTGTDPVLDLYPALVAATAVAALATARDQWLRSKTPRPLIPLIREVLAQIERGLPEPSKRKPRGSS